MNRRASRKGLLARGICSFVLSVSLGCIDMNLAGDGLDICPEVLAMEENPSVAAVHDEGVIKGLWE